VLPRHLRAADRPPPRCRLRPARPWPRHTTGGPILLGSVCRRRTRRCRRNRPRSFIAVGYSIGGLIAQTLWHRDRHSLSGLVLGATAHCPLTLVEWALSAVRRRGLTAHPVGPPDVAVEYLLRSITDPEVRADVARRSHIEPWVFASALQAAAKFDARPWIDSVDVAAAVVVTTRDAVLPSARARVGRRVVVVNGPPSNHPMRWFRVGG
jgi:pimeloyl-ACP methyl ester carboxylesterase